MTSLLCKERLKKLFAAPLRKVNRQFTDRCSNNTGHQGGICETSSHSRTPESRPTQAASKMYEYDYRLGRNAFEYFLTDMTHSICKDKVGANFMDVFDNLFGNFSYENCYKHLMDGRNGSTAILTVQEHQSHYRAVLFTHIGAVRRQNSADEISRLPLTLSKFMGNDCEPCEPKHSINPSNYDSKAGGFAIPPIPRSSNSLGVPSAVEAAESTATSRTTTALPSTSQHGTNDTEDIAFYTMLLKEIGDEDGEYGICAEERVQFEPPWWKCTVKFRGVQGIGEGSKKRTAKHKASKLVYLQLGYPALS